MKRLFALVGLVYLAVQTAVFYVSKELGIGIAAFAFVTGLLCLFFVKDKYKKKTFCVACISAIAAGLVFYFYSAFYFQPLQKAYNEKEVSLYAQLTEEPHKSYGTYYYELTAIKADNEDVSFKVLLKSANQLTVEPFDYISCDLTLAPCDNNYYLSKNYLYVASAGYDFDYNVTSPESYPVYYYAVKARQAMKTALDVLMPESLASLSKAIALGDKFALDADLRADFTKTGISYLIVVSGLHLAIVASFMTTVLRKIFRSRYIASFGTILFIIAFMAITGFSSSVVRSGIMLIIFIFGQLVFYQTDSLNSLGIAALCLCVPNPFAVGDVGMLLSFSATAGIILFSMPFENLVLSNIKNNTLLKIMRYPLKIFSVTLSAFTAILPITLLAFNSFSPVVFAVSAIITPFVSVLIICILLCSLLYYCGIFAFLAYPFALIACGINSLIILVVELFAKLNVSVIYVSDVFAVIFLSGAAILIALALLFRNYKIKLKYALFMIVLIVFTGWSFSALPREDSLQVIKSGEGSAVLLDSSKGLAVLSCGGSALGTSEVIKELEIRNSSVSLLAVPDNNKASSRFAADILQEFDCAAVLLYDTDKTSEEVYRRAKESDAVLTFSENESAQSRLWNEVTVNALNIDGYTWEYVKSADYSVLIVPAKGDCSDIPDEYRTADIIVSSILPDNYNLLNCGVFVYTGSEDNLKEYTRCFAEFSNQIATTINDSVTIPLKE